MDLLSLFVLWTSKAFDKSGSLYSCELLMDRRLPRNSVAVLQNWFDNYGHFMLVFAGNRIPYHIDMVLSYSWCHNVRQGGVLFVIYMDVLIVRLRLSGFGCCVFVVYFGCLVFAANDTFWVVFVGGGLPRNLLTGSGGMERGRGGKEEKEGWGDHLPYFPHWLLPQIPPWTHC